MSEFYGLEPGGLLPATALAQLDTARMEVVAAGRPDIPSTTPYTSAQLDAQPVGTEYRSTDGPQGAWRWRKTGATSWTVTDGDTGWRSIPVPSSLPAGVTFNGTAPVRLRRTGDMVSLIIDRLTFTSDYVSGSLTIPITGSAFTPASIYLPAAGYPYTANRGWLFGTSGLTAYLGSPAPDSRYQWSLPVDNPSAWPTTLPGTPA